ncbi:MAG: hypothetical protein AAF928_17435 [Myxococcota bacterium]
MDLIIGIDLSGSIFAGPEVASISSAMNTLAQAIDQSGHDIHVTLVAFACSIPSLCPCIGPPLGKAATCGEGDLDSNPPRFRRVSRDVSEDVLSWLVYEYDTGAAYRTHLRDDATPVFLVFTDDDPRPRSFGGAQPAILTADAFEEALFLRDPARFGSASDRRFIFNSVVGTKEDSIGPSFQKCAEAETLGGEYQELSLRTGGFITSICTQTPASILDSIANGLVGRLSCEVDIAAVDDPGEEVDRSRVRLLYTPGDGSADRDLDRVASPEDCTDGVDEFVLDDTRAVLCPATCNSIRGDTNGRLTLAFGCAPALF